MKYTALARASALGFFLAVVGLSFFPQNAPTLFEFSGTQHLLLCLLLIAVFTMAEFGQVHFEFRRRALSVSLSDLPLVIGLFILPPWWVLAARLIGAVISSLIRRRAPSRILFNMGLFTAEVSVSSRIFYTFVGPEVSALNPESWLPVWAAIVTIDVIGVIAVLVAISWIDNSTPNRQVVRSTFVSVVSSGTLCTALGLLVAGNLSVTIFGVALLLVVFGAMLVAHRAYHTLFTRHKVLGRLYEFTQSGAASNTTDDVVSVLLQQACILLHAENAVLRPAMWFKQSGLDRPAHEALVIPRRTTNSTHRQWLANQNLRDAVIVPVHQDGKVVALLQVSNRLGEVGSFGSEDVNVLQTLVAHVEVLWQNSSLVDKLRHDARHDPLTGLDNRTQLLERLTELLARDDRSRLSSFGNAAEVAPTAPAQGVLAILDVRLYSTVNDALGQHIADLLLIHVAARLDDWLPEDVVLARVGDDLFAALIPGCKHDSEAQDWVAQIKHCLAEPLETQGMLLDATPRIGYALIPHDGQSADAVLQNAHVALVAARRDARGEGVSRYRQSDSDLSVYRLALAGELRQGIMAGQITVIYQPKVSSINQRVVGFEALARWEHPKRGLIMPDEFIPLADNTGQLGALTASVMQQALDRASEWMLSYPEVGISVNLSARQLLDPGLPEMVDTLLRRHVVPASALTLEITESRLMSEPDAAHAAMQELRSLGVRLSVDDFGTGYSSLSYLQTLPLDEVKIDKSFVLPLVQNTQNHAIVRSIIELVHVLGLEVVAEGVETEPIRDLLAADGCDVIQGFLIGRGITGESITEWLTTWQSNVAPISLPD